MNSLSAAVVTTEVDDGRDVMNDPAFDTNTSARGKGQEEVDTCRICRGEGFASEPLFYPCKCSGSIKFVHQDCLMEWLSHSQKKHCELCKTPFRFTKLYHPHMPSKLPTAVFIRKAILHLISHLLVWLRAVLVAFVWLVCLPWCMRSAWSFLFWFADAGWARDRTFANSSTAAWLERLSEAQPSLGGKDHATSPHPASHALNSSSDYPLLYRLGKAVLHSVGHPMRFGENPSSPVINNATNGTELVPRVVFNYTSLLSEVQLLKDIMPSPVAHRLMIDIFEGQIITLLVVVAFILIFLIREWVVQQQPVIDMAQADLNNALEQAGGQARDEPHELDEDVLPVAQEDHDSAPEAGDEDVDETESQGSARHSMSDVSPGVGDTSPDEQASKSSWVTEEDDEFRDASVAQITHYIFSHLPEDVQKTIKNGSTEEVLELMTQMPKEDMLRLQPAIRALRRETGQLSKREDSRQKQEIADTPEDDELQASAAVPRPIMPSRHRSSLVTEIRRDLEERGGSASDESETEADDESTQNEHELHSSSNAKSKRETRHVRLDSSSSDSDSSDDAEGADDASTDQPGQSSHDIVPSEIAQEPASDDVLPTAAELSATPNGNLQPLHEQSLVDSTGAAEDGESSTQIVGPPVSLQPAQDLESPSQGPSRIPDPLVGQKSMPQQVFDWFWGDVEEGEAADQETEDEEDDVHVVEDLAQEAPFVPFIDAHPALVAPEEDEIVEPAGDARDPEVVQAAVQAGIDPNEQEAAEDAEDLEGILELIGMQGPIVGLFQNALFSAVLIVVSVLTAVFIPYLWGKVVLLCVAMPELVVQIPLTLATGCAEIVVDAIVIVGGILVYLASILYNFLFQSTLLTNLAQQSLTRLKMLTPSCSSFSTFRYQSPTPTTFSNFPLRRILLSTG